MRSTKYNTRFFNATGKTTLYKRFFTVLTTGWIYIRLKIELAKRKTTKTDVKNHIPICEKSPFLGAKSFASLWCSYGYLMCNYNWISLGVICWHNHSGFLAAVLFLCYRSRSSTVFGATRWIVCNPTAFAPSMFLSVSSIKSVSSGIRFCSFRMYSKDSG